MMYMTNAQSTACTRPHRYTVEVVGSPVRYAGTSEDDTLSALIGISEDEEGYVVAEHDVLAGRLGCIPATEFCGAESNRMESLAMTTADEFASRWQEALDGAYDLAEADI